MLSEISFLVEDHKSTEEVKSETQKCLLSNLKFIY